MGTDISHSNFNSKHYDKCKFALKFIPLVTTSNLFSLEVVQRCQNCLLWKNSNCQYYLGLFDDQWLRTKSFGCGKHFKMTLRIQLFQHLPCFTINHWKIAPWFHNVRITCTRHLTLLQATSQSREVTTLTLKLTYWSRLDPLNLPSPVSVPITPLPTKPTHYQTASNLPLRGVFDLWWNCLPRQSYLESFFATPTIRPVCKVTELKCGGIHDNFYITQWKSLLRPPPVYCHHFRSDLQGVPRTS